MSTSEHPENQIEQFLTFELAGEAYGIDILKVQEIRGWEPVRKLPNTPDFVKGALNLRGAIVPIIDLRERFNMETLAYSATTVVIVLTVHTEQGGDILMGLVADAVSDVFDINPSEIKKSPHLGSKINTRYIRGMYVRDTGMVMLLDIDKLLDPEEFISLNELS